MARLLLATFLLCSLLCTGCELDLLGSSETGSGDAGSLDKSFNSPYGFAVLADALGADARFKRAYVQDNGRIVLVGTIGSEDTDQDILIARYLSDGSLDSAFGISGVVTYSVGVNTYDQGKALAIDGSGRILVGGYTTSATGTRPVVVRLLSNGNLDTNFGTGGAVLLPVATGGWAGLEALAVQSDGKIVGCGPSITTADKTTGKVWRLTTSGVLDTSFATDGVFTDSANTFGWLSAIGLNGDGTIVTAGYTTTSTTAQGKLLILRLTPLGKLDTSFGSSGYATWKDPDGELATALDLVIASDGSIFTAGYRGASDTDQDFLVLKFSRAGKLSTGFGSNGAFIADYGTFDVLSGIALQSDGRVVAAGYVDDEVAPALAAVRLQTNGKLDTGFADKGLFLYPESGNTPAFGSGLAHQTGKGLVVCGRTDGGAALEGLVLRIKN